MVPVAQDSLLVKGARLFFRLTEHLAPFMFEVPRAFGSHDALLRRLGARVREEPLAGPLSAGDGWYSLRVGDSQARAVPTEPMVLLRADFDEPPAL